MSLNNLKLGVDVISAYIREPEDGQGSTSPYVELFFDGQIYRTTVKDNNLSPVWDESFYLSVSEPSILQHLNLEAYVYSSIRGGNTRSLLGKVFVSGSSFVPHSDAVVLQYPLKKGRIFSRINGEIQLKVYITDDPSINSTPIARDLPRVEYFLDLVERMDLLYVNVVKARDLPIVNITESPVIGCCTEGPDVFVEVRVGKYKGVTKHIDKNLDPDWNVVFAFSKDGTQDSLLDVEVKSKGPVQEHSVGIVRFDLNEVPMRVPPNSPLAAQWYCLEENTGKRIEGELMVAVWTGTQADAAFYDAWHLDDAIPIIDISAASCTQFRPKVYHAPTLWYAHITVIEAQDLQPTDRTRFPEVYVKAQMGGFPLPLSTKTLRTRTLSPHWNEDIIFVVTAPFEGHVVLTVRNHVSSGKDEVLGSVTSPLLSFDMPADDQDEILGSVISPLRSFDMRADDEILGSVTIPLRSFDMRADDQAIPSRWYNLEKPITTDQLEKENFCSRLHLRLCLDGGYHVLDGPIDYSSDLRPTAKQLCKASIGFLELGICKAEQLRPMKTRDGKETSDTYCVAKYGKEWVRTRTIIDSLSPKYNEQYKWEVYDRATVLTLGVFDSGRLGASGSNGNRSDCRLGKVDIRISALEPGRVYSQSYPLKGLRRTGVETMGQLHLAVRFSSTSVVNIVYQYSRPVLPKMHYIQPILQPEISHTQAMIIVAKEIGRAEPALGREVVEYMLDPNYHFWSIRRSKANFYRLMGVLRVFIQMWKWFEGVCSWRNPIATISVHISFLILVYFPVLILPLCFLCMFLVVVWNYRFRLGNTFNKDPRFSQAETCHPDELDEEFDSFPTSKSSEVVRMRYDRLRSLAAKLQEMVGQSATQGERLLAVLTWRDPFATAIFGVFCLVASVVVYVVPLKLVVALSGLYAMRHPWFRSPLPSLPTIFLTRLPDRTDSML